MARLRLAQTPQETGPAGKQTPEFFLPPDPVILLEHYAPGKWQLRSDLYRASFPLVKKANYEQT